MLAVKNQVYCEHATEVLIAFSSLQLYLPNHTMKIKRAEALPSFTAVYEYELGVLGPPSGPRSGDHG